MLTQMEKLSTVKPKRSSSANKGEMMAYDSDDELDDNDKL